MTSTSTRVHSTQVKIIKMMRLRCNYVLSRFKTNASVQGDLPYLLYVRDLRPRRPFPDGGKDFCINVPFFYYTPAIGVTAPHRGLRHRGSATDLFYARDLAAMVLPHLHTYILTIHTVQLL